jgi:hypothetical protein
MSGALAQFRTPTRPLMQEIEIDLPAEGEDEAKTTKIQVPVMHPTKVRLVCTPHSLDEDGNPTEYYSEFFPAPRHVLDYRLTPPRAGPSRPTASAASAPATGSAPRRRA